MAGRSNFLDTSGHCEVARQPEKTPGNKRDVIRQLVSFSDAGRLILLPWDMGLFPLVSSLYAKLS